jgi:hypothetical protein
MVLIPLCIEIKCLLTLDAGGIGPADQLAVVAGSTDGPTMIGSQDWIYLPVGYNLDDHVNVSFTWKEILINIQSTSSDTYTLPDRHCYRASKRSLL